MNDKSASPEELEEARSKLQDLLTSSSHYQPQPVLTRMKGTELHVEIAAVYGRVSYNEFSVPLFLGSLLSVLCCVDTYIRNTKLL